MISVYLFLSSTIFNDSRSCAIQVQISISCPSLFSQTYISVTSCLGSVSNGEYNLLLSRLGLSYYSPVFTFYLDFLDFFTFAYANQLLLVMYRPLSAQASSSGRYYNKLLYSSLIACSITKPRISFSLFCASIDPLNLMAMSFICWDQYWGYVYDSQP